MTEPAELPTRVGPDLLAEFWDLWQQGRRPDLGAFLRRLGDASAGEKLAVLRIDQEGRWRAGERAPAEEYLAEHPDVAADPEKALELVYCEYLLRKQLGESPAPQEYLGRFPALAERLRQQIELHEVLGGDTGGPSTRGGEALPATRSAPSAPPAPPKPASGAPAVAGYEVVRELGRGGMGVVYEARETARQRTVALKVMQWLDPAALYRFKQEFRALADLNHPNLVTLYELVAGEQLWFFTMELIEGAHFLRHVRGKGPARPGTAPDPAQLQRLRDALAQLADGLLALHAAGKLHRDVKPANVLVTPQGRVKLLDFGLAADLDRSGKHLSVNPRLLGTLAYMAPEQADCRPVSPASDWYAVGAMLYEALTGRLPFDGSLFEVLRCKQSASPTPPGDIAPGVPDDLAALALELLRTDPAARPSGAEVRRRLRASGPAAPAGGPGPPPATTGEGPLVGRRGHLAALREALEATRQGRAVTVAVHGRSGAGKSALLRCFLDGLVGRGEAVVLAGRCYEQESVPYKAFDELIDALSRYLEGLPAAEVQGLLPRDLQALTRVFPVLRRVEAVEAAPRRGADVGDPQEVRRRARAALRELLSRLGDRQPLVLAIDDLQWGDADSAGLLADLLQPPDPPVLLLLGSYRSEDAEASPCLGAFGALRGQGGAVEGRDLAVEPLAPAERHELVRSLLGDGAEAAAHAEAIARQSGGYPFFVHELVRYLLAGEAAAPPGDRPPGPAGDVTLSEVLWGRILRLPESARQLLEVVAVAGRPLGQDDACRAAGSVTEGPQALACLRAGRLLRGVGPAEGQQVETYHDRIRETVVAHLAPAVRRQHHRRLAEVLLPRPHCDPEVLAVHLLGAGEPACAAGYYFQAAEQAAEALAFDRAVKLYRRVLELRPAEGEEGRRLHERLADALAGGGHGALAAREYQVAAEGAAPGPWLGRQRRAALLLLSSGHVDDGLAALRAVLRAVGMRLPESPRGAFWALVWQRLWLRLRGLGFVRRGEREVPAAELGRLDVCTAAAVGLSMVNTVQGAYFQSRALLLALRAGEPARLVSALAIEGAHESIVGTRGGRRAGRLLEAARALAEEVGEPYPRAKVALARGIAAALAGDWPQGQALCDAAEATFRESCAGVMWELGTAHRFALWPLLYMGELAEIAARLPGLMREAQERDDLYGLTNLVLVVRTMVLLAADDPARARRELAEAMARWSQQGFHVQHMNRLFDEAQIDLYQGDGGAAWGRVTGHWPLVERSHLLQVQQVRIFLRHLRGRAALAAARDRPAEREALRRAAGRDARALWREGAPWGRALAQLLDAGAAALGGARSRAAGLLRDAAARCEATAMRLYAAAARRALGELLGGAEGQGLVAEADFWMATRGVANPARMAALLVPGFGPGAPAEG